MGSKNISIQDFIRGVDEIQGLSAELVENDCVISIEGSSNREIVAILDSGEIDTEISQISSAIWDKPFVWYANNSAEAFAHVNSVERTYSIHRLLDGGLSAELAQSECSLRVSYSSNSFVLALICLGRSEDLTHAVGSAFRMRLHRVARNEAIRSLDEFLFCFNVLTVSLATKDTCNKEYAYNLIEDFFFNISVMYGFALSMKPPAEIKLRGSRGSGEVRLFPYRKYNRKCVLYYQQGVALKGIPFAQYLAFYHVVEYHFATELREGVLELLYEAMTSFYPDEEHLRRVYSVIESRFESRARNGRELTDLECCLKRYIDLERLGVKISELDENSVAYYEKQNVSFIVSEDNPNKPEPLRIRFENSDENIKTLARRIYLVRCAIVHSKSDFKSTYEPFQHDAQLNKEIPLMRAIAEEIIISTSKKREMP